MFDGPLELLKAARVADFKMNTYAKIRRINLDK